MMSASNSGRRGRALEGPASTSLRGSEMRVLIAIFLLSSSIVGLDAQQRPAAGNDWPQWRGPSRDGAAAAPTDPKAWPEQLTQKWKVDVGLGYATPLVIGNRIYQFARQGEREVMSAIDADSGKILWQTGHAAP